MVLNECNRYNSVFYSTTYASDYFAAAVTEEFFSGGSINRALGMLLVEPNFSEQTTLFNYSDVLHSMQNDTQGFKRLDAATCMKQYSGQIEQAAYRNVLMVLDYTHGSSWLAGHFGRLEDTDGLSNFHNWTMGYMYNNRGTMYNSTGFTVNSTGFVLNSLGSTVGDKRCPSPRPPSDTEMIISTTNWKDTEGCKTVAKIEYCVAESLEDLHLTCTVGASTRLLGVVIVCNALKVLCLLTTLLRWRTDPLAVVGDAIASFLEFPDPTTRGLGTKTFDAIGIDRQRVLGMKSFLDQHRSSRKYMRQWLGKRHKWGFVVSSFSDIFIFFG